jgi:hypothetical protein
MITRIIKIAALLDAAGELLVIESKRCAPANQEQVDFIKKRTIEAICEMDKLLGIDSEEDT